MSPRSAEGLALLHTRAASIPDAVAALVARGLPSLEALRLGERTLTVTAAGIAEGPARFLVQALGARARFVPSSAFALAPQRGDLRVVFSQALSPHARLALGAEHEFADTLLFTSADEEAITALCTPRLTAVRLEPTVPEDGLLLRVLGPAVARVAALLLSDAVSGRTRTPLDLGARVGAAWQRGQALASEVETSRLLGPVAFVSQGEGLEGCRALAWKWMEGLWGLEPPVWDVLQFAHGPLQGIYEDSATLITLEPPGTAALFDRLASTLDASRHTLLRSSASLSEALGVFEHDVVVNALLLRALSGVERDLSRWPAQDRDGPLYQLEAARLSDRSSRSGTD